jgi:sortase (surface protein transpeptidase)
LTDVYGNVVTYVIYNMYYTSPDDADYMVRDVEEGVREISLSTCNDDSTQRLIIWAREQ